ncbi:sialate O-acetylesterase, partial [uncultured Duncaniella sp.]
MAALTLGLAAQAEVKMPAIFGDNMVMQQNTDANMWGTAKASSTVTVTPGWTSEKYTTKAGKDGKWKISIPTPSGGGPYDVTVSDGTPLTLSNVMLGEVWLCSGQSNMEMPMKGFKNQPVEGANQAILRSANPDIRLFTVKRNSSTTPVDDVTGSWAEATPESVRNFSATAYFFGRDIEELLGVPVGLVVVSWGGSACEAWMNDEMLAAFPEAAANIPAAGGEIKSKNRTPSVLFKGMLNPLIGMSMRGV